jgi:hypothetical protein
MLSIVVPSATAASRRSRLATCRHGSSYPDSSACFELMCLVLDA